MNLVFASGVLFPQEIGGILGLPPLVEYFDGLRNKYPDAFFPGVSAIRTVEARARQLGELIGARFPAGRIHIVAHSMGGLDARCMISQDMSSLQNRIASLSTIATPHRGSPLADLIKTAIGDIGLKEAIDLLLGDKRDALDDLTTQSLKDFNKSNKDVPTVKYFSYAGGSPTSVFLSRTHDYIEENGTTPEEKANDGAVSVASAKWPVNLTEDAWGADHFAEVGHKLGVVSPFNHIDAFQRVVQRAEAQAGP